jgi:hypothetical protein
MRVSRHGKMPSLFHSVLLAAAVAVGFGWTISHWQEEVKVLLESYFRRGGRRLVEHQLPGSRNPQNEQHDNFINAVTHELKTPLPPSGSICKRWSAGKSRNRNG